MSCFCCCWFWFFFVGGVSNLCVFAQIFPYLTYPHLQSFMQSPILTAGELGVHLKIAWAYEVDTVVCELVLLFCFCCCFSLFLGEGVGQRIGGRQICVCLLKVCWSISHSPTPPVFCVADMFGASQEWQSKGNLPCPMLCAEFTDSFLTFWQGLSDPNNYHEFCRLLARLKSNYQLGELVKVDHYAEVIKLIAEFTVTSLRVSLHRKFTSLRVLCCCHMVVLLWVTEWWMTLCADCSVVGLFLGGGEDTIFCLM